MTTYKGLKPDYVQLTLPLVRIKQEAEQMIKEQVFNIPKVNVEVDNKRVSANLDFTDFPESDIETIRNRTGLMEDGAFRNGYLVLARIFSNIEEDQYEIISSELDSEDDDDAPYVIVKIPFKKFAEEAL